MKPKRNKKSSASPRASTDTSLPYRLTPAEIEALRQDKKETMAWAMKRFAYLKPIQRTNQG